MRRPTVEHHMERGLTKARSAALAERQRAEADAAVSAAVARHTAEDAGGMRRALLASVVNAISEGEDALTASCMLSALSFRIAPGFRFRAVARAKADSLFKTEEAA